MGLIHIMERGGSDYHDYKKALKKAKEASYDMKEAIEAICELTDDMEEQYGERSGYRMRGGYSRRGAWEDSDERYSERSRR